MKTTFAFVSVALCLCTSSRAIAQLPTGTWKFNGNSFEGELVIKGVDKEGRLEGTVYGQAIVGRWNAEAKKITFLRVQNANDPGSFQAHTGYLFQNTEGDKVKYTLTGFFVTYGDGGGGNERAQEFGWYAQIVK